MIVVDTNILIHFWLPSDHSHVCDQVFQKDSEWVAPFLWISEFRNVIGLYIRKNVIDVPRALQITESAELQMKDRQFHIQSAQVFDFTSRSQCSSYDCEIHLSC